MKQTLDKHSLDNYEIRDMFTLDKFLEDKVEKNFDVLCIDVEGLMENT